MTCQEVRSELVECWANTELLSVAALEHLEECKPCHQEALLLRETHMMVQTLPREHAPRGFTSSVLENLDREQRRSGWPARIGEFFVPAQRPSWARAAAVGAAIALAVAGGAVWYNQGHEAAMESQIGSIAGGLQATADTAASDQQNEVELEELLVRHQTREMTQPLADDAGVSLVVYSSN